MQNQCAPLATGAAPWAGGLASQTKNIRATKKQPDSQNRSLVASSTACWLTIRSSMAGFVAAVPRLPRLSAAFGSNAETCALRMLWWNVVRRSHRVMLSEVPKLPARMREKFDRPVALGISWGGMSERVSAVSGTKKVATPKPISRRGITMCWNVTSELNWLFQNDTAANTAKLKVAQMRRSTLCMFLPTTADRNTGRMPMGAAAIPAQVAV